VTYIDDKRRRVSSESAYLTADVLSRKNLTVATHAQVTRILFDKQNGETRAIGVEFANSPLGPRYRAFARKEVILSWVIIVRFISLGFLIHESCQRGSCSVPPGNDIIHTAGVNSQCYSQVLMLSGVGPAAQLRKHGIDVIHDLPGVGDHLVDHCVVDLSFKDKYNASLRYFQLKGLSDVGTTLFAFTQYFVFGKGGSLATNVSWL
jgi:choline dehydrogenase